MWPIFCFLFFCFKCIQFVLMNPLKPRWSHTQNCLNSYLISFLNKDLKIWNSEFGIKNEVGDIMIWSNLYIYYATVKDDDMRNILWLLKKGIGLKVWSFHLKVNPMTTTKVAFAVLLLSNIRLFVCMFEHASICFNVIFSYIINWDLYILICLGFVCGATTKHDPLFIHWRG